MCNVGRIVYGFCNGYFGRDDYEDKIIVFETECSICCRYITDTYEHGYREKGWLTCANFKSPEEKQTCIDRWNKKEASYNE